MNKAKGVTLASAKFKARLDEVSSRINQIRSQLEKLTERRQAPPDYDVTYTAIELCAKVERKWPAKFLFFQAELGEAYEFSVQKVCELAQKFVHWCKVQFKLHQETFYAEFKSIFPVVWNKFLEDCSVTDVM